MIHVGLDEPPLLLEGWILGSVANVWRNSVVIIVCPFGEVVGKLQADQVRPSILEIDDDQLFVLVGGLQQRRLLIVGPDAQDVAILSLNSWSVFCFEGYNGAFGVNERHCGQRPACL